MGAKRTTISIITSSTDLFDIMHYTLLYDGEITAFLSLLSFLQKIIHLSATISGYLFRRISGADGLCCH